MKRHFLIWGKIGEILFQSSKLHLVKDQSSSHGWLTTSKAYSETSIRGLFLLFHKDCLIAQGYDLKAS